MSSTGAGDRASLSTYVSTSSAAVLAAGGIAFLFASDVILPALVPSFPATAAWIGQLVAAGWLGLAALNWLHRRAVLGGIYARPVVLANLSLYFISALVLGKAVADPATPPGVWLLLLPAIVFAGAYGWLLLRGPFSRDLGQHLQH